MTSPAAMMIERLAKGRPQESPRHSVPLDILVVDDDQTTRLSLAYSLSDAGHHVTEACDGEEAIALASERTFDVALLDVRLPKVDGLTIFRRLRLRAPATAVILMTAFATIPDAVATLREGAYDYVTKPIDPEELTLRVIGHIAEHVSLKRELEEARRLVASRDAGSPIVGHTPAMIRLVERVNTVAQSDAPVLVCGESGTGKELVAHTLHARGPRKVAPFVALECAAFPENVIDAELFGEERGGITTSARWHRDGRFRAADGGTLMLGEVAALPLSTQAKLLRVLTEGLARPEGGGEPVPVNARIVSTTQIDLKKLVAEGKFRDDLYFRLNVLDLHIPPLRERKPDMPLLLAHFLRRFCPGRVPPGIGPRAWEALMAYPFPGNVRELAHAVERAVVLARGGEIDLDHLPEAIVSGGPEATDARDATIEPLGVAAKSFEKRHITNALHLVGGELATAAVLLGISVRTLRQRIARHGISIPRTTRSGP
ncbi:MAG: sigma-54-dependent Fis family transcriptional regulator [Myxococcales bacterium]|nr:sigma-54-dependent Fis family transcriptional regulator [Myxococcales bacterium]